MHKVVDDINNFITTHQLQHLLDQRVSFSEGSVCFGSGFFGWSCSVDSFLHLFHQKDGSSQEKRKVRSALAKRDNFVKHIIKPIMRMHRASGVLPVLKKDPNDVDHLAMVNNLLSKIPLGVCSDRIIRGDASMMTPRMLLKKAMMAWLPAADALVDMVAIHIPSPVQSQRLRAGMLYAGDIEDECGQGIYHCDPLAPTVVYICKMSPAIGAQSKRLLAFGRVFSGTVRAGDVLRVIRTDGSESKATVSQIKICGIKKMHSIPSAEAGQLIALEGVDEALSKAGTLTNSLKGLGIRHMETAVRPTLQHSIRAKDKRDQTKLVAALERIVSADTTALFFKDPETQEFILAGAGELHIEVLVSSLLQSSGIEIELSKPIIAFREMVQSVSSDVALAKSDNKHNRVYIKASPLDDEVIKALSSGELANLDSKALSRALARKLGWKENEASKLWAVGPEPLSPAGEMRDVDHPTCVLVDSTFGLQIPQDARENITAAFQQVVRNGVLVKAPMRGVRFDLVDAKFHSDAPHRRPNSVVPAASRAMCGALMMASPRLSEPFYRVDITGGPGELNGAYSVLGRHGAIVVDTSSTLSSDTIQARLPVRRAFGLGDALRRGTQGRAHCTCVYDGMEFVPNEEEEDIVADARIMKHLDAKLPVAKDFIDRL
jgi:elongation factor 2